MPTPTFAQFLFESVLTALHTVVGLSVLFVVVLVVTALPYSIYLGVEMWVGKIRRRRRAAKITFP